MLNVYDFITDHPQMFRQFKVNDLLFVEYHCIIEEAKIGVWTHNNYFSYTLKGKKGIKCLGKEYHVDPGDVLFIKKGAFVAQQFIKEDYCALFIFIPDEFIQRVVQQHQIPCPEVDPIEYSEPVFHLNVDEILATYFHSVLNYFSQSKPPPKELLKIKFKELIIDILSGPHNPPLAGYFKELCSNSKISIREIMEANFAYNMKMEEFARLCGRSLSAFKRDFVKTYGISPGRWLTKTRLAYSKYLLETTDKSISQVAFDSGFANRSHFIRIFKEKFGRPPLEYRNSSSIC